MATGIYPAAARVFRPWKNGGGETAEILAVPAGAGFEDFALRLSTARVAASGPFSVFPGVGRVLTVLEGGAMELEIAGARHRLDAASPPFAFAGDLPCTATLNGPPLLDLNVMVRHPGRALVRRCRLAADDLAGPGFALLLAPAAGLVRLDLVDLAALEPPLRGRLEGAEALHVRITRD